MYAVKGGWVGQTFALAKRNESEGRKSRIRRSKEERKAMVETFIKKYQESNQGSFPSLNLTHKEVGGSFYTVREIVRDIIQENRVLGPAKFTLEELTSDQFLEQDPLGSTAIDPQSYLVASPSESHHEPDNLQYTSEKMHSGQHTGAEGQLLDNGNAFNGSQVDVRNKESIEAFGNENLINGSQVDDINQESLEAFGNGNPIHGIQVDETNKESVEASSPEFQVNESLAPPKNVEQDLTHGSQVDETNKESVEASSPDFQVDESLAPPKNVVQDLTTPMANVTPLTEDVIVERFPLRPVTSTAIRIESFGEFRDLSISLEKGTTISDPHKGKESSEPDSVDLMKNSDSYDEKSVSDVGNIMVNQTSAFGNEEEEKDVGHTLVESTKQAALEEHYAHDNEVHKDPRVKATHQSTIMTSDAIEQIQIIDGAKASIQDGFHAKNLSETSTKESQTKEESRENVNEHRVNGQLGGSSQKGSNPTLDRINLESWDGTPKKSVKPELNPIVAIFRALVDAFVKFWSE